MHNMNLNYDDKIRTDMHLCISLYVFIIIQTHMRIIYSPIPIVWSLMPTIWCTMQNLLLLPQLFFPLMFIFSSYAYYPICFRLRGAILDQL